MDTRTISATVTTTFGSATVTISASVEIELSSDWYGQLGDLFRGLSEQERLVSQRTLRTFEADKKGIPV